MKREKIPTEFIIETLTDGYYWSDFAFIQDLAFDYAREVLNIPEEYLESVEIEADGRLKITLPETGMERYVTEDWYCALKPFAETA